MGVVRGGSSGAGCCRTGIDRTTPVTGFALGATLVLCVLAAATAGAPLVLATFKIARRQPDGSPAPDADLFAADV